MIDNYTRVQYHSSDCIIQKEGRMGSVHLGDIKAASDLEEIAKNQITTVITAAEGFQHLKYSTQITHIKYPLLDSKSESISRYFEDSFKVIQYARSKGNVLVHCAAGVSRSSTLVIAYLMNKKCWSFKKAIQYVRERRSIVCPNLGFQMQLKQYQKYACQRSALTKSTILKAQNILKRENNLPQICQKTRNKFMKYQRLSNVIKKPERQMFFQNRLNLPSNLRIVAIKTPMSYKSQQLKPLRPFRRFKPSSSQLFPKFSSQ